MECYAAVPFLVVFSCFYVFQIKFVLCSRLALYEKRILVFNKYFLDFFTSYIRREHNSSSKCELFHSFGSQHCIILYCIILLWCIVYIIIILCCVELCWVVLCCVVLCCIELCCVELSCAVLCCVELLCVELCWVVLSCVELCCVVLCCVVLCCVELCCVVCCVVGSGGSLKSSHLTCISLATGY